MEHDHLSVVTEAPPGDGESGTGSPASRQPSRLKPKRPLPTDRLKLDKQTSALRAYVRASDRGNTPAGAKEIAPRIGVGEDTAGLVNNFFVEAGFLIKAGKGKYRPVPEVVEYARVHSFDAAKAVEHLAKPIAATWYFTEVKRELEAGSAAADVLISVLAQAAGVGAERKPQLAMVLEWLIYAGLIKGDSEGTMQLGYVSRRLDAAGPPKVEHPDVPDSKVKRTTEHGGEAPATSPPVLAFNFAFSLSADDLKKLKPDQIAAMFEAVGKVMAIKAEAGIE